MNNIFVIIPTRIFSSIIVLMYILFSLVILWDAAIHFNHYADWTIGGWLINYSDGFVRRGLSGEITFGLSHLMNIKATIIVALVVGTIYLLWAILYLRSAAKYADATMYVLLIMSPLVFTFYPGDAGMRKEIILFLLLSLGATLPKRKNRIFVAILAFYPFIILFHEALFAWFPAVIGLGLIRKVTNKLFYVWVVVGSSLLFSLCILYKGTHITSLHICNYIIHQDLPRLFCGGAVGAIGASMHKYTGHINMTGWLGSVVLLLLFYIFPMIKLVWDVVGNKKEKIIISMSMLACVVLSAPLFYVADDWGRFIRISFVAYMSLVFALMAMYGDGHESIPENVTGISQNNILSIDGCNRVMRIVSIILTVESFVIFVGNSNGVFLGFNRSVVGSLMLLINKIL